MTSKKKKSTSSNTRAAKKQRRADPPKLEIQLPPEVLTCAQFAGARRVAAQQKLIHAELPQTVKQAYTVTLSGGGDSVSFYSIPRGAEQPDGWLSYNSGQMWHLHEKIQRAPQAALSTSDAAALNAKFDVLMQLVSPAGHGAAALLALNTNTAAAAAAAAASPPIAAAAAAASSAASSSSAAAAPPKRGRKRGRPATRSSAEEEEEVEDEPKSVAAESADDGEAAKAAKRYANYLASRQERHDEESDAEQQRENEREKRLLGKPLTPQSAAALEQRLLGPWARAQLLDVSSSVFERRARELEKEKRGRAELLRRFNLWRWRVQVIGQVRLADYKAGCRAFTPIDGGYSALATCEQLILDDLTKACMSDEDSESESEE